MFDNLFWDRSFLKMYLMQWVVWFVVKWLEFIRDHRCIDESIGQKAILHVKWYFFLYQEQSIESLYHMGETITSLDSCFLYFAILQIMSSVKFLFWFNSLKITKELIYWVLAVVTLYECLWSSLIWESFLWAGNKDIDVRTESGMFQDFPASGCWNQLVHWEEKNLISSRWKAV